MYYFGKGKAASELYVLVYVFFSKKYELCTILFLDLMSHSKHGVNNIIIAEGKKKQTKYRGNKRYYFLLDALYN